MYVSVDDLKALSKIDMMEIINELLDITDIFIHSADIEEALLDRGIEQHIIDILNSEGGTL